MVQTLRGLSHSWAGSDRPDYPILAEPAGGKELAEPKPGKRRR